MPEDRASIGLIETGFAIHDRVGLTSERFVPPDSTRNAASGALL